MQWYVCKFKKSELEFPYADTYYVSNKRNGTIRGKEVVQTMYLHPTIGFPNLPGYEPMHISPVLDDSGHFATEEHAQDTIEEWQELMLAEQNKHTQENMPASP